MMTVGCAFIAYAAACAASGLLAIYKGNSPAIAVEFARRVLPSDVRPTFEETEQFCRAATKGGDARAGDAAA